MAIRKDLSFEDELIQMSQIPKELALLPINDAVVFPLMMVPLLLNDPNLLKLADEALADQKIIGAFTQKDPELGSPGTDDIYRVGAAVHIQKMIRFPNGEMRLLGQGITRIRIKEFTQEEPYMRARIEVLEEHDRSGDLVKAYKTNVVNEFMKLVDDSENLPDELKIIVTNVHEPGRLADLIATNLNVSLSKKQSLLEETDVLARLKLLSDYVGDELEVIRLGKKLQGDVRKEMDREQHEYYLRQQLKAIKRELGDEDDRTLEIDELREKIEAADLPEAANDVAEKEVDRLSKMSPGAAEYTVSKTYIDWILDLPWNKSTEDNLDIDKAKKVLDEDHYDLESVKERILEFLSVKKLKHTMKGSILNFAGPPGVGKTSLGKSIARAMGRKFVRISLGGMKDEAEVRGHRRTYIGALPGRIIQSLRTADSNNPVLMLDEIDKLGNDFRGDPSSALLEVLDPAQNDNFEDHYLNIPFDLSKVMFLTTANTLEMIPRPLLDRMEVLELPGYITLEKIQIGKRYLLPRQIDENGLKKKWLSINDDGLRFIIQHYTREAGVRELERKIGTIARKIAFKYARGKGRPVKISPRNVRHYLGVEEWTSEAMAKKPVIGVVTGLAKTYAGGEILFIEGVAMRGHGNLRLTGQLGDVMKESAQAAVSYVRHQYLSKSGDPEFFDRHDLHLHVPAGAIPKDGPSAGVAMAVVVVSLLFQKPLRNDYAMTGEITLTGKVLAIGGLKDKVIAAHRAGIKTVLFPRDNKRDISEIPEAIQKDLELVPISKASEAIDRMMIWDD